MIDARIDLRIPPAARGADISVAIRQGLIVVGNLVRNNILTDMTNSPPSGRIYRKYRPNRMHTASSGGNSPRVDTGALRRGVRFEAEAMKVTIGAEADYSKYLEGRTGNGMRPFIKPVIIREQQQIESSFEQVILNALVP